MSVRRLPLSYYVGKLQRKEPFTYLSYGDGEFHAMSGLRNGVPFTAYHEVVTPEVAAEMRASLDVPGDDIIRGTDEFIVEPDTYKGTDQYVIREANRVANLSIGDRKIDWVDGTVWDESVKNGLLGSLLKTLSNRHTIVVGTGKLCASVPFHTDDAYYIRGVNALSELDATTNKVMRWKDDVGNDPVYVLCVGLGAIPLALRIRGKIPGATVIDLGSALDVFAGLGADRGWRKEVYNDPVKHRDLIRKNLEGVV